MIRSVLNPHRMTNLWLPDESIKFNVRVMFSIFYAKAASFCDPLFASLSSYTLSKVLMGSKLLSSRFDPHCQGRQIRKRQSCFLESAPMHI